MWEVELRREQQPSGRESSLDAYRDIGGRATHDSRDGGGRIASGTAIEEAKAEQRPGATHDSRDGGGRIASGTAIEDA